MKIKIRNKKKLTSRIWKNTLTLLLAQTVDSSSYLPSISFFMYFLSDLVFNRFLEWTENWQRVSSLALVFSHLPRQHISKFGLRWLIPFRQLTILFNLHAHWIIASPKKGVQQLRTTIYCTFQLNAPIWNVHNSYCLYMAEMNNLATYIYICTQ